ncbi:MAG: FliM/FliN family flagellar motor switch protein [Legionellaceae bacterium]|nr:FliM/FliN family flagellar motor switch protein [Legionellaceae bacterium]
MMNIRPFKLLSRQDIAYWLEQAGSIRDTLNLYGNCQDIALEQCMLPPVLHQPHMLASGQQPLLLFAADTLDTLQRHLLKTSETHPLYQVACQRILQTVFGDFFHSNPLNLADSTVQHHWFYPGSPCLKMSLHLEDSALVFYLNPDWVREHSPPLKLPIEPRHAPLDCLSAQPLQLQVCAPSFPLTLRDLKQLAAGDVIQLNHPLNEPWLLQYQNKTLATVTLGQQEQHWQIKIGED